MAALPIRYNRLEPLYGEKNFEEGFRAPVYDPLWFLTRQWQMGEHQGENASSPVLADYLLESVAIQSSDPAHFDPALMPAEAIVESELDDWWTMGRRIRAGRRLAGRPALRADARLLFRSAPPPYEAFADQLDGKALWDQRARLGLTADDFTPDAPPVESPQAWNSRELIYHQTAENGFAIQDANLLVRRHPGGRMDWHSVDAQPNPGLPAQVRQEAQTVIPQPLQYPGAPNPRWWQIEDSEVDLGGYAPDSAHAPTAMLTELVFSHSDDWFLFPVTAQAGSVVKIRALDITDAFGRHYTSQEGAWRAGLNAPADWSLFQTRGLEPGALVLWHVAELPLESAALERVQFGIDQQANLLWAVERTVDQREVESRPEAPGPERGARFRPTRPSGDAAQAREYRYLPGKNIVPRWHPYQLPDEGERVLIQRGLPDLTREVPLPMPRPEAAVLQAGTPELPELHVIQPGALPSNGIEIERRWVLARDMRGAPVLWIERQRKPLRTPPARLLRFDVLEEGQPSA